MKSYFFKIYFIGVALAYATSAEAQKTNVRHHNPNSTIIIDDSLAANAEKMEVHPGGQVFGKDRKFHIGKYAMVSHKNGGINTRTKENFFNTKSEKKSTHKFSFVLSDSKKYSADVVAMQNKVVKTQKEMVLGVIHVGDNEWVASDMLAAQITINEDTRETWTLYMGGTGSINAAVNDTNVLSNGERVIILTPVGSIRNFVNIIGLQPQGYEFIEDGKSLCAIQYSGIGFGGPAQLVWIDRRLDEKMKLVLAAAMTVIYQKTNS